MWTRFVIHYILAPSGMCKITDFFSEDLKNQKLLSLSKYHYRFE